MVLDALKIFGDHVADSHDLIYILTKFGKMRDLCGNSRVTGSSLAISV
jgi:hypothetical protein